METIGVAVRVVGRVQGVGFRNALKEAAVTLSVVGWARNRGDGTVEAHMVGSAEAVDGLLAWCQKGSPMSRIEAVHAQTLEEPPHYSAFTIL